MRARAAALIFAGCAACSDGAGRPPDPPPPPPLDEAVSACNEVGPALAAQLAQVAEAEAIPRDQALYALAARLARLEREVAIVEAESLIVDTEIAAPDFVLQSPDYRARREAERIRVAGVLAEQQRALTAARDEAPASRYPAVADPGTPSLVLSSIRWRDAAATLRGFQAQCAAAPTTVDVEALRDVVSGLALIDGDAHDVGNRAIEQRLLDGEDLARVLP